MGAFYTFRFRNLIHYDSKYYLYLIFGPIFVIGKYFGVLPIEYFADNFYIYRESRQTILGEGEAFKFSTIGRIISWSFLLLNLYLGYTMVLSNTLNAIEEFSSCYDEICDSHICRNVCAHFIIIWINHLANLISILSALFYKKLLKLFCLNEINEILSTRLVLRSTNKFPIAIIWFIMFFFTVHWTSFFIQWRRSGYEFHYIKIYLPFYMCQCVPLTVENLISVMLLILQLSYKDINEKLAEMIEPDFQYSKMLNLIRYLKEYHWRITSVVINISECFGWDFVTVGFCTTVRFIYFLFVALKFLTIKPGENQDRKLPDYDFFIFLISVVGKFFYLCYRGDTIVREHKKTINLLQQLQIKLSCNGDTLKEQTVAEFVGQIECRGISIQACNLYTLDLHLILSVFGVTLTYFIVLVQFQLSHEESS